MKGKPPFLAALAAIAVLLAALLVFYPGQGRLKGRLAPAFSVKDRSGKDFMLEDFRGKPVILYFWSTWAPPSRLGMPQMVRVQAEYRKKNLVVVGVAVRDNAKPVFRFLREMSLNFPVVVGTTTIEEAYFGRAGIKLPMTLILDGKGMVREQLVGYQSREDLVPLLENIPELAK